MFTEFRRAAGRHSADSGPAGPGTGGGGPSGRTRDQIIGWTTLIVGVGTLIAGTIAFLPSHGPDPASAKPSCGLVHCSAVLPVQRTFGPSASGAGAPGRQAAPQVHALAAVRSVKRPPAQPASRYPTVAALFNNVGITNDGNTTAGDLDGSGYSLSAQALAAAGAAPGSVIQAGGVSFTWPNVQPGQLDNIVANGQTVAVNGSGTTLGFLLTSAWGPASGNGTILYTDGTAQSFTLTAPDWFLSPPFGSDPALTMNYRNVPGNGRDADHQAYVYFAGVPLAQGKTVGAVVLPSISSAPPPSGQPSMHIFAMAIH